MNIVSKQKRAVQQYRLSEREKKLLVTAAQACGESRSEFLRTAARERARRILGAAAKQLTA